MGTIPLTGAPGFGYVHPLPHSLAGGSVLSLSARTQARPFSHSGSHPTSASTASGR